MRIVNRATFLALPVGTLFSKFTPIVFGDLCIKGDSLLVRDSPAGGDFCYQSIADSIACSSSQEFMAKLDAARRSGASLAMDFASENRDGLFDVDQLFALWERADVLLLIARLQATVPPTREDEPRPRYRSFGEVVRCDAAAHVAWQESGSEAACAVALANKCELLFARVMELESIAPKKIRVSDGRVFVWHCPDDLIPEQ